MKAIASRRQAEDCLARIRHALQESTALRRIVLLRNQASELLSRIKSASLGRDLLNRTAEVKLIAERKAGKLLPGQKLHGGDRESGAPRRRKRLADFGISSRSQAADWQSAALFSHEDLAEYLKLASRDARGATTSGLLRWAKMRHPAALIGADPEGLLAEANGALSKLVRQGRRFAAALVDPPWPGGNEPRAAVAAFAANLAKLPPGRAMARKAHLHLWVNPAWQEFGMKLLNAWGFQYEDCLVFTMQLTGDGRCWRQAHKTLLLGIRGGLAVRDKCLSSWVNERPGMATESARRVFQRIQRVSPPPFLSLFAAAAPREWLTISKRRGGHGSVQSAEIASRADFRRVS